MEEVDSYKGLHRVYRAALVVKTESALRESVFSVQGNLWQQNGCSSRDAHFGVCSHGDMRLSHIFPFKAFLRATTVITKKGLFMGIP